MALLTPIQFASIVVAIATYFLYMKWLRSKYPPGPWPLPIIGNLHQLSQKPYKELTQLSKVYGPVFTVWMAWQPTIVITNLYSMKEAAVEKGIDFAGRSLDSIGFRNIFYDNEDLSSRSYDEKTSTMRKLCFSIMKTKAIGGFSILKVVNEEIKHLLNILKDTNEQIVNPELVMHVPLSNTVMRTVINIRFENERDTEFLQWDKANVALKPALEKAMLLSILPPLTYLMPSLLKTIRSHNQLYDDFIDKYVTQHEESYKEGVIRDLTDVFIQHQRSKSDTALSSQKITRVNICGLLKNMLGGGSQTTLATILWALLVLLHRRDVQEKIQNELDQCLEQRNADSTVDKDVKDDDNMSSLLIFDFSDKLSLPYLNSFIHETMRLWPIGPVALPHQAMVDTHIGTYSVPKGTSVLFNVYGCHRDATVWDKPLEFIPERFLDSVGNFDNTKAKQLMLFGAGTRSCVGETLAKIEIFTLLANVLHTFDLRCPSVDELPVLSDGFFRLEFVPYPFKMMFTLRKKR